MTDDTQQAEEPRAEPVEAAPQAASPAPPVQALAAPVAEEAAPVAEAVGSAPGAAGEPVAEPAEPPAQEPKPAAERKPRAPRKPKAEGKAKAEAEAKPKGEGKPKAEAKPKGERKPKGEGKPAAEKPRAEGKPKAKGKAEAKAAPEVKAAPQEKLPPRLKVRYKEEILPALMRELGLSNPMQAPRLRQVVINMGVGVATQDPKALEGAVRELAQITGQRPAITRARKSIAAFKVRENNPVGCRVTLRGDRMYEFLDRLFNAALPRIRDFRGLPPRSFDGRGNYTMGIREQLIFPELSIDEIERVRGMDITIATTAKTDEAGRALLSKLGLPLRES